MDLLELHASTEANEIGLRTATHGKVLVAWNVAGGDRKPIPTCVLDGNVLRISLTCRVLENCRATLGIAVPEGVALHGKIRGADVEARRLTSPLSFELTNGRFTGEQLSSSEFTVRAANGIKASVRSAGKIRAVASGDHDTELHLPAGRYAIDAETSPLRGAVEIEEGIRQDPNATGRVFARADHWPRSREHRTGHVRIKIAIRRSSTTIPAGPPATTGEAG